MWASAAKGCFRRAAAEYSRVQYTTVQYCTAEVQLQYNTQNRYSRVRYSKLRKLKYSTVQSVHYNSTHQYRESYNTVHVLVRLYEKQKLKDASLIFLGVLTRGSLGSLDDGSPDTCGSRLTRNLTSNNRNVLLPLSHK